MKKLLRAGAVLVALQAVLIGGYLLLEGAREDKSGALTSAPPERIASPMPSLAVRYGDGSAGNLARHRGQPLLLHFWATWCPPCRQELPGLLALAERSNGKVLLIALDDDWTRVRRFLDAAVPAHVALADSSQVERFFGVRTLPETFVVDAAGNMMLRFRGARDWTVAATLDQLPQQLR